PSMEQFQQALEQSLPHRVGSIWCEVANYLCTPGVRPGKNARPDLAPLAHSKDPEALQFPLDILAVPIHLQGQRVLVVESRVFPGTGSACGLHRELLVDTVPAPAALSTVNAGLHTDEAGIL